MIGCSLYKRIYISGKRLDDLQAVLENCLELDRPSISYFAEHRECLRELHKTPCDLLVIDVESCPKEAVNLLTKIVNIVPSVVILWVEEPPLSA